MAECIEFPSLKKLRKLLILLVREALLGFPSLTLSLLQSYHFVGSLFLHSGGAFSGEFLEEKAQYKNKKKPVDIWGVSYYIVSVKF